MDPSALIFVALAVAWAVYLIPKALEHHEEGVRTRTVERFSATLRVLARREPVNRRTARLVSPRGATATDVDRTASRPPVPEPVVPVTAAQLRARRAAAARAAKRRLRVVTLLLLANAVVAVLAAVHVFGWAWCAVPVGVLVAWLVACRLMVKRERAAAPAARRTPVASSPAPAAPAGSVDRPADETSEVAVVPAESVEEVLDPPTADPESWDPVPVTLPTYVSKPVAPRSVRTIDLDSTGVWSSGRSESDSALAREADAAEKAEKAAKKSAAEERRSS